MNDTWHSGDIDAAKSELIAAGWVEETPTLWTSPSGTMHRGPAGAWRVMKRAQNDERTRPTRQTESWAVTVERNGEAVVTLASNCLSGRDLSPEDEATIRTAARHLLAFVGESANASR